MKWLLMGIVGIISSATLPGIAIEPPAPEPEATVLSQHIKQTKSDLVTPEKLFKHIAVDIEAGKPELAFAHFSPSDTNWKFLRSMGEAQQRTMAAAFRRARSAKTLSSHARTYEIPFEENGETQWTEAALHQGPDGLWTLYSW